MFKKLSLIICILLVGGMNYAGNLIHNDDITILASNTVGNDKSSSISASINGNTLTVVFTENLGNVDVEITNAFGAIMSFASLETPTGYQFFITIPGQYTITFTLPNGDEYYGNFVVTN